MQEWDRYRDLVHMYERTYRMIFLFPSPFAIFSGNLRHYACTCHGVCMRRCGVHTWCGTSYECAYREGEREEGRKVYIRGVVPHTSVHTGRERGRKEGREEGMERTGDDKQRNKRREAPLHSMCFENCSTPHSTSSTLSTWLSALINMAIKETTLLVEC